jgi:very-short-patch-repair endonuclease
VPHREDFGKPVDSLLKVQGGVLARRQITSPAILARILRRVAGGSWQAPWPGLYVDHNGPLTARQRRWSALLACGPAAAWAGPTVIELGGITGHESDAVHIAVPHKMHGAGLDGVVVVRMRHLDDYVHAVRTPRQLRLPIAVLQTAAAALTEADAHAVLCASVQQGRVSVEQLSTELELLTRLRRRALLRESLIDIDGRAHSINEIAFRRLVRKARLPEPKLQVHVAAPNRKAIVDGGWPEADIWFEIDGELHRDVATWVDDLDRANELAISQGGIRLRWSGFAVRRQPEHVLDQIHRAFAAAGQQPC